MRTRKTTTSFLSAHQIRIGALIAEARAFGKKRFYTGEPCKRGHVEERLISTGNCLGCIRIYAKEFLQRHPGFRKEPKRRAVILENARLGRLKDPSKSRANALKWAKNNPARCSERVRARKARINNAIPKWANREAIRDFYELANESGKHVDHIVPLKSSRVCGLHCEDNLQMLSPTDNHIKGNRWWPDMP